GVTALGDGSLAVRPGEVHLLLGENGAGKSTLMKIIAGIVERDAGQMLWQGREVHLKTPAEAAAIGISMVHQESLLAPHLTVAEARDIDLTGMPADRRAVSDRVTRMRDGRAVLTGPLPELTTERIIHHMVGREVSAIYQRDPLPPCDELLRVEHLNQRGRLNDISFSLHAGEIVGLAGLIGAGRTELCRALFGVDPVDSGKVFVCGREVVIGSPKQAVKAGIALVTEDRQITGLAVRLPIAHNL